MAYCTGPGRGGEEREGEEGGEGVGNEEGESFYDGEWKNNRQHGTGVRRYRSRVTVHIIIVVKAHTRQCCDKSVHHEIHQHTSSTNVLYTVLVSCYSLLFCHPSLAITYS